MTLFEKQVLHARKISVLIQVAFEMGLLVTLGHAFRCETCHTGHLKSLHKYKLANDLNLFRLDGEYLDDETAEHNALHDVWDMFKGSARRIEGDLNHYATAHFGMR